MDIVRIDPVEAKAFDIRRFAIGVRQQVDSIEDIDQLQELDAVLTGCRHRLKQLGEDASEAERARLYVVQRIGFLLGDPEIGRPRKSSTGDAEKSIPGDDAKATTPAIRNFEYVARLLARYPDAVEIAAGKSRPSVSAAKGLAQKARAAERATETAQRMAEISRIDAQQGQWWKLGDHRLYCGDSTDDAFIDAIKEAQPTLAFADPPYNVDKAEWDSGFVWAHDYLTRYCSLVAVTPGNHAIAELLRSTEMRYRWSIAAWITNGMTLGGIGFQNWINVLLFGEGSIYREAQDFMKLTIDTSTNAETSHASRKPLRLLVNLLDLFTSTGDTVCDPFLGSGTTLIAADKSDRKCIGAEIDPVHCGDIVARYGKEAVLL